MTTNSLPPELDIKETENFDKKRLDKAFGWIAGQIRTLSSFKPDWQAAIDDLRTFGLQRINEAIAPAYQRVINLSSFGFLKAESDTALTLALDATRVFVITNEVQRSLFTPTEFVAITRVASPDDWAIGRVVSYDAETGNLQVVILSASVSPGAHDDWQITATAATLVAASKMLAEARKVKEDASAIKDDTAAIRLTAINDIGVIRDAAIAARLAAEKAADDANAAALLIAGGPVTTVNGRNGPVELTMDDIPDLENNLNSRADKTAVEAAVNSINEAVATKADQTVTTAALADRYTKAEANGLLAGKRNNGNGVAMPDGNNFVNIDNGAFNAVVNNSHAFKVQSDGNLWTPLYGYINIYIANKCNAAEQAAKAHVKANFVQDIRLAGGSAVTGGAGGSAGEVIHRVQLTGVVLTVETKYIQKNVNGAWYTIAKV